MDSCRQLGAKALCTNDQWSMYAVRWESGTTAMDDMMICSLVPLLDGSLPEEG